MFFPCPRDQGDLGESTCVFVGEADATPHSFIALNRESVGATTGADCARFEQEARRLYDKVKDKRESLRSEFTEIPQMMKSGSLIINPKPLIFIMEKMGLKVAPPIREACVCRPGDCRFRQAVLVPHFSFFLLRQCHLPNPNLNPNLNLDIKPNSDPNPNPNLNPIP